VYLGYHPHLKREVAIKVLPAHLATDQNFRLRFQREARTVAGLSHPNIVHLYDFGDIDGVYYMVMEYLTGSDLGQTLQQRVRLPLDEALALTGDIAAALDYAHSQGVVHRDVKPSNVMMAQREGVMRAVLTDFGIARIVTGSTGITRTGMLGTLEYVAPEQIEESSAVDGRADIYALGVMLFQMVTGELPFKGENPAATVLAHLQKPAPNPRDIVPDLPDYVTGAILRALQKSPDMRFQTAHEFAEAVHASTLIPA
jgi:serine/threonine-protein kinase